MVISSCSGWTSRLFDNMCFVVGCGGREDAAAACQDLEVVTLAAAAGARACSRAKAPKRLRRRTSGPWRRGPTSDVRIIEFVLSEDEGDDVELKARLRSAGRKRAAALGRGDKAGWVGPLTR